MVARQEFRVHRSKTNAIEDTIASESGGRGNSVATRAVCSEGNADRNHLADRYRLADLAIIFLTAIIFLISIIFVIGESQALDLAFVDSMEVMDVQVLIAFALGVPHHGHFD